MASSFGNITNPFNQISPGSSLTSSSNGSGLFIILNVLVKTSIVVAGLYAFINIIIAGYGFLSSTEPKEIGKAWSRIFQSMIGLTFVAGSFVLAAIFGWVIFGDPLALLTPKIYAP